ncbi:MAG: class I SAM-dependent methyltransferase [Myxococcales bacterium]|nr:MAG: class I SAM-dependent methyltransferase [Myxococcales bacterium]
MSSDDHNVDTLVDGEALDSAQVDGENGQQVLAAASSDASLIEARPTDPPEAKLVLELESAEFPSHEELGLEPDFDGLYQPFSKEEVTDEIDMSLRDAELRVLENEPTRRRKSPADETISLEEPDEVLDDGVAAKALQSKKSSSSRPVPPPPPAGSNQQIKQVSLGPMSSTKRWWEQFFNDDYLRSVKAPSRKQVARQCDFIEGRLALESGASILDVGCGLGLHAVELASRGYAVVGLDISLPMLSRASEEAQERSQRLNFLHADMRELSFERAFDAVICWGTTFGYFDDESNRQVIERLYRTLKPKGRMLLGVSNRDFVVRTQPNVVWFEGDACLCMEETAFDYIASRLDVKRTLLLEGGRQRESNYSLRMYNLHEVGHLLHNQGFRVAEVSGSTATPGVFFGADSPEMLILAERRPSAPFSTVEVPDPGWDDETARPTLVEEPGFDEDTRVQDSEPAKEE